ncbi:MAG: trypsin-like peptidase domain-containing protein [Oligoflexia bacterium]|nr:trypsin-like peptidase domain-containing protein [Oligoflexia bacterium]
MVNLFNLFKFIKQNGLCILLCFFMMAMVTVRADSTSTAGTEGAALFKRISAHVFQIKTAKSADAPKSSYGTGFVVNRRGYLITNYHVIASIVHDEDNNYKAFLVDGQKNFEAKVVAFSAIHDIALIKVDKIFDGELSLYPQELPVGSDIYSLGLPEDLRMAIVNGNYNGVVRDGVYERIFMTTPINAGMSGGPTVDGKGRVVGVNVSYQIGALNITFSVPIKHALSIMSTVNMLSGGQEQNLQYAYSVIEKQLEQIQNSLMQGILHVGAGAGTAKEIPVIAKWRLIPLSDTLKCWGKNITSEKKQFQTIGHYCYLKNAAFLEVGNYSGTFEIHYEALENISLSTLQFYHQVDEVLNKTEILENAYLSFLKDDSLTKYACDENLVVTKTGIPFRVNFCLSGLVKYKNLYKLKFKAVSLRKGNSYLIVRGNFDGIGRENVFRFMEHHLAGIEYKE